MQTLILNHYPPVIKQIKEMQQIAKAEDIEFSKLNESINGAIQNMFVFTADETGVRRFEKLLGIKPKAAQSLDDRKMNIIFKMNQKNTSVSDLETLLSFYSDSIMLRPDFRGETLTVIYNERLYDVGMVYKALDDLLPMNVYISAEKRGKDFQGFLYIAGCLRTHGRTVIKEEGL